MRYGFTSFSLPQADLPALLAAAQAHGYDGVELRLDSGHGHGVEISCSHEARAALRAKIAASPVTVDCLGTSVRLADPATAEASTSLARTCIDLAGDVGIKLIRVFGGAVPDEVSRKAAQSALVEGLKGLTDHAASRDVVIGLESHDDWSAPQRLADVMAAVDHPSAAILWDVWHTGRAGGKSLAEAHRILAPWIRHVHIHDGRLRLDRLEFLPIGHGDLDHLEILALLTAGGYSGVVSGEWINWGPGDVHLPRERRQLARYEALLDSIRPAAASEGR